MSLIDDALKRAREEAARQDEALRREKRPWIPPAPKRLRSAGIPVLLAAASAVLLLGGAAWFVTRNRAATRRPADAASAPPAPVSAAPRAAQLPPVLETVEVPPPAGARTRAPEPSASAPSAAAEASPALPAPRDRRASAAPTAASPPQPGPAAAPSSPRASRGPAELRDGSTFVRVADLPSGEKIELGGIVWSDTNPVAVIGGQLLSPGARIGDFQIIRIEENRVTLRGRGVTIYITP